MNTVKFEELISAEEAKTLTAPKFTSPDQVASSIMNAIKMGYHFTTAILDDNTVELLTEKGYTVNKSTATAGLHFIEWK